MENNLSLTQTVWKIVNFKERFLADKPLFAEEIAFREQIDKLKSYPNSLLLTGAYMAMVDYFMNSPGKAYMSLEDIRSIFRLPEDECRQILQTLIEVGLIERTIEAR